MFDISTGKKTFFSSKSAPIMVLFQKKNTLFFFHGRGGGGSEKSVKNFTFFFCFFFEGFPNKNSTVPPCLCLHGRPAFGASCNEFFFPGGWHFIMVH